MDIRVKQTFLDLYLENQNISLINKKIEEDSWGKNSVIWSITGFLLAVSLVFGYFKLKKEMSY